MYKVLIVDDEPQYVQSQIELAGNMGIDLVHYEDWDKARIELESGNENYEAIIIDAKGKLKAGGKAENIQQLTEALMWFREQKGKGNYYYYIVNTGFADQINVLVVDEPVYGKYGSEKKMFEDILANIENNPIWKIKTMYSDAFEVFTIGLLNKDVEQLLIASIQQFENNNIAKGYFNSVRDILEAVYKYLNSIELLPNDFIIGGKVNLEWSYRYLSGLITDIKDRNGNVIKTYPSNENPVFPKHISKTVQSIKEITSILSHDYDKPFTKYAFRTVNYGILEILVWLKSVKK